MDKIDSNWDNEPEKDAESKVDKVWCPVELFILFLYVLIIT